MFDLRKFFVRTAAQSASRAADPDSDYHPPGQPGDGLEVEYQRLIANQFRRWGIPPNCATIEVRRLGQAPDGFDVLVGMVRLTEWERTASLRVLLGLPLLETKIRKTVRATWLADFSHFAGLWVHAAEQMRPGRELHDLLAQLAPFPATPSGQQAESSGYTNSSLSSQTEASSSGSGD
jgi:hypothetical protein